EAIAAVYSSPLERCRETAELVAKAVGCDVVVDERLLEVDYGEWTGATFEDLKSDARWAAWNYARGVSRAPGGESLLEVQSRMRAFLDAAVRRHAEARIVAVSHGDPIKALLAHALGAPLDNL